MMHLPLPEVTLFFIVHLHKELVILSHDRSWNSLHMIKVIKHQPMSSITVLYCNNGIVKSLVDVTCPPNLVRR